MIDDALSFPFLSFVLQSTRDHSSLVKFTYDEHLCVVAVTIVREGPSSTSLPLTPSYDPPFICSSSTSRRFFQHAIEVSNIVLNLIFRSGPPERSVQPLFAPSRTQSKTFGAHLSLKTRLSCFFCRLRLSVVLICRATPASHAPRLALTRELQMWRACSTSAPASNKFCIFTKVLHLHLSEVRSRQSTTSHNIIRLLRSSQVFLPETEDEA